MSIIGKVGRNSKKVRILNFSIHFVLILGALTMIYPFLLMISFSFKSNVDSTSLDLIPAFIYEEEALYKKYIESRYNEESSRLMDNYPGNWISFAEVTLPQNPNQKIYQEWNDFLTSYNPTPYQYYVAEHYGRGIYPYAQRIFRKELRNENDNSLIEFNKKYNTGAQSWEEIVVEEKDIYRRNFVSSTTGYLGRFRDFKVNTPHWMRYYVNQEGTFINSELIPEYGDDISDFNNANGTNYQAWANIPIPQRVPEENHYLRDEWIHYTKRVINIRHLKINPQAEPLFQAMLAEKYNEIKTLNKTWQTSFADFNNISIPDPIPDSGALVEDLAHFIQNVALPEDIYLNSISREFQDFLTKKYSSIVSLNKALTTNYNTFEEIPFPVEDIDYYSFYERKSEIRREFLWRNYAMALDQMLSDARSLRNTGIYVLLSILLAITVNPLAAYALSRFKPRFSYQIILLFMLTMAFPAMVMGIPNFLMLKNLSMLNTFWALVLPAAADGYFIFLLKGFFDSLPRELYESASLDGASEFRLFWQFTLYLSKPILAVIALGAFNAAYRNFLFAFLVCQDQSMWTLMVHIYELMQRASSGVGYAALVIAAMPTLGVFIFFQRIIIEGIVIPMEK
ncbi:beta-galactosidase [bacterium]|nr:beta-galactosidase [bacterium]